MEQTLIFQHMRYIILFMCLMASVMSSFSQTLSFKYLNWWNPGYPTVVDAGFVKICSDAVNNQYGIMTDNEFDATKKIPGMEDFTPAAGAWEIGLMWTLKSIDGTDFKELSDERVSQIINNPDNHKFRWETPFELDHITIGLPSRNYNFIKTLNIDFDKCAEESVIVQQYFQKKLGFDVLVDWDVDWSKIRTYDFILRGNDPLTDKKILEEFAKSLDGIMTRDTESPDVFITIAKDSESSVSYSYVPPKVDYIKTGSTTRKVYNWVGQNPRYSTEDHYQKIESQGYTKEINQSDIFLEICMLDASKIEQGTPPIIYKGSIKKSYPSKINILEKYLFYAGRFGHPLEQKFGLKGLKFDETIPYALRWGLATFGSPKGFWFATKESPQEISMIYRPSLEFVSGTIPEVGDVIIKRKTKNHRVHSGAEWFDMELTYKTSNGKTNKFTILSLHWLGSYVIPYMGGDYWFRPYLMTVEE